MIYIAVQLIQIFSAGPATGPRGSEVVQEVLADLKTRVSENLLALKLFLVPLTNCALTLTNDFRPIPSKPGSIGKKG